jgi:hypothetical protein
MPEKAPDVMPMSVLGFLPGVHIFRHSAA